MTDKLIPLRIAGVGYSLPETVITNDDLTKLYETSDRMGFIPEPVLKKDVLYQVNKTQLI